MTAPSLIDVMARALDPDAWGNDQPAFRHRWEEAQSMARAALRAMLDHGPTERMVEAGRSSGKNQPFRYAECFRAMLRAELEDKP